MFGLLFLNVWTVADKSTKELIKQYFQIKEEDMAICISELKEEFETILKKQKNVEIGN